MKKAILICCILIAGCSSQKDIVREKIVEIKVPVPAIAEQLEIKPVQIPKAAYEQFLDSLTEDSYFYGIKETDELKVKVRFYPKRKLSEDSSGVSNSRLEVEILDSIKYDFKDVDTTHQVLQRTPVTEYLVYFIIILALIGGIIVFLKFKK
jgi:hypothetical protein